MNALTHGKVWNLPIIYEKGSDAFGKKVHISWNNETKMGKKINDWSENQWAQEINIYGMERG